MVHGAKLVIISKNLVLIFDGPKMLMILKLLKLKLWSDCSRSYCTAGLRCLMKIILVSNSFYLRYVNQLRFSLRNYDLHLTSFF